MLGEGCGGAVDMRGVARRQRQRCRRDRDGAGQDSTDRTDRTDRTGQDREDRDRTGTGTVSYTHLRAHENGRKLVCRPLPKKKKSTDPITTPST